MHHSGPASMPGLPVSLFASRESALCKIDQFSRMPYMQLRPGIQAGQLLSLCRKGTWAARAGDEVDPGALLRVIFQALCQAGTACHVAQQKRAVVHADRVFHGDIVILRHGDVMEESKGSPLQHRTSQLNPTAPSQKLNTSSRPVTYWPLRSQRYKRCVHASVMDLCEWGHTGSSAVVR